MTSNNDILTPNQLNTLARDLLESTFPMVWVEGELGSVSRPASGHLYFTLKDARAQVRAAMFKPKSQWLKFLPREGMRVLVRGRLTLYEARGDYQLILDHMEEAGEGALRRAYDELKARLEAEGLFDPARKRPMPAHVRRLAVITSPSGAAVRDVLSVLERRFPMLEVELLPSLVQGATAAPQITSLLRQADASGRYDVILLTRGGGSLEDLWAFNDEQLTRAVAASNTPVVSAVGHETDFSLTDFAADLRAPTPSVAAELLVPDQRDLALRVRRLAQRLNQLQVHAMSQAMQRADRAALRLQAHSPQARLTLLEHRQQTAFTRLQSQWRQQLERRSARLAHAAAVLRSTQPQRRLDALAAKLAALAPRANVAMGRQLQRDTLRLQGLARSLEAVSPLATVARGYSILTRAEDGALVRSADQVQPGEPLRARLAEGELEVRVERINRATTGDATQG
ncbi:exodeoxyribonuclease VII large subunit [Stenotrophomonas pigmentata]|uniref:exodeoxyribonuclease VII large subunit n=1 Tax=Stenotrophomonas pigmentata TaxID=3055080 RepID=UPI00386CCBEF